MKISIDGAVYSISERNFKKILRNYGGEIPPVDNDDLDKTDAWSSFLSDIQQLGKFQYTLAHTFNY